MFDSTSGSGHVSVPVLEIEALKLCSHSWLRDQASVRQDSRQTCMEERGVETEPAAFPQWEPVYAPYTNAIALRHVNPMEIMLGGGKGMLLKPAQSSFIGCLGITLYVICAHCVYVCRRPVDVFVCLCVCVYALQCLIVWDGPHS